MSNQWKLVPVKPTQEMLDAAYGKVGGEFYKAVLDAATTPPQPIYDEAVETMLARFSFDALITAVSWSDFKFGWLACAQSRSKAGEVGHE